MKDCLRILNFSVMMCGLLPLSAWAAGTNQLPLTPVSTTRVEVAQVADSLDQSSYFPRRRELRRCFITTPSNCVFDNRLFPTVPSIANDLSLDYRKSAFLAEISAQLARMGEYDDAEALTQTITFPFSRVLALTAIASEYAKAERTEQVQQALAEAAQIIQTEQFSGSLRIHSLIQIGIRHAAIEQPGTALSFLNAALLVEPTNNSFPFLNRAHRFGEVAVGLLAAEQTAEAERIIRQILQESQEEGSVIPDSPSILEPLLAANEHDFAIRLVQEVNEPTRRTRWLTEICLSLVNSGEYNHAKQLAQTIRSESSREYDYTQQAFPIPIDPEPASLQLIPTVSAPRNEACFNFVVVHESLAYEANQAISQMQNGDTSGAIASAQQIQVTHYRRLTLTEIAIALAEAGETEQAEQVLLQVLETTGSSLEKMQIAVRLSESGQFARALEIVETIEEDSYKVIALLNVTEQYVQVGEQDQAQKLLSRAIEIVRALRCSECRML
jgi:tetratricopeptide (TPR) repeat protein